MKKQKKFLALTLALVLLVSMIPASVFPVMAVEKDYTVTYDFEKAEDLFVPDTATDKAWTLGPAPDYAEGTKENHVMIASGSGGVFSPDWSGYGDYNLKTVSFEFNIKSTEKNGFSGVVLWQDPDNWGDRLNVEWENDLAAKKPFNNQVSCYNEGSFVKNDWWGGAQGLKHTYGEGEYVLGNDSWFRMEITYYEKRIDVTLTDLKYNKTTSAKIENFSLSAAQLTEFYGDYDWRHGKFGFTAPKDGTLYIDNVVLTFDGASVAAAEFKKDHKEILAMTPDTFATNYDTEKGKLVAALDAYQALSADAKAWLTAEKEALDALEAIADAKIFTPLTKGDLNSEHCFVWTFEDRSHSFRENSGTAVDGFGITVDPTDSSNRVLTVPSGTTVYTPARWNDNYGLVSVTWRFNTKDVQNETGDLFNEIVLWQDNENPERYITWFWKQESGQYFNDGYFVYNGTDPRKQHWEKLRIGSFSGENKWFTLTAIYHEDSIDLILNSEDGTVKDKKGTITIPANDNFGTVDLRQGKIAVKGSAKANTPIYYDNITVKFDFSAEEAASFRATYVTLLDMSKETFRAEYATAKEALKAALNDYEALSDSAKALLVNGEKAKLDVLKAEMDAIIEEQLFAPFTKADLNNYSYTWDFEGSTNPFKATYGTASENFGVTAEAGADNHILSLSGGNAIYGPRKWNHTYSMETVTMRIKIGDSLNIDHRQQVVIWQSTSNPGDYITLNWKKTNGTYDTSISYYLDGTRAAIFWFDMNKVGGGGKMPVAAEDNWVVLTLSYKQGNQVTCTWYKENDAEKSEYTNTITVNDKANGNAWLPENRSDFLEDFDIRKGSIGVAIAGGDAALCFDDISVTFDSVSVDGLPGHTLTMATGAWLRTREKIGIRFGATITDPNATTKTAVGYGMLVLPASKLAGYELTVAWTQATTTPVAGVTAGYAYKELGQDEALPTEIYGAIVDIMGDSYPTMALVARAYVKYSDGSISYSDLSVERSMYQTAMLAVNAYLADGTLKDATAFTEAQYNTTDKEELTTYGKQALQILNDAQIITWNEA